LEGGGGSGVDSGVKELLLLLFGKTNAPSPAAINNARTDVTSLPNMAMMAKRKLPSPGRDFDRQGGEKTRSPTWDSNPQPHDLSIHSPSHVYG
jgi:hypothetical protein